VWAALADAYGSRRAVAMTEGEVAVSLAGICTPLLIGALAATAATWRLAFAIGTVTAALAAVGCSEPTYPHRESPLASQLDVGGLSRRS